jgi:hypothetical protein
MHPFLYSLRNDSIRSFDFERQGDGFQTHIRDDHNMWSYLFFMMHIQDKPRDEWTALEHYFHRMIALNQEQACFPIARSIVLESSQVHQA